MVDEERGTSGCGGGEPVEGGFSIFLDEGKIKGFMESGDYSSAKELSSFEQIGSQIEHRTVEGEGFALFALSVGDKRISRDFAVLQIAHTLAKHGKRALIVDCDFLQSGLSGLIDKPEDQGFLDFLLYGSSLKSVAKSIGIDGVTVMGAGSFPVSRTVPFALREFEKINGFLKARSDVTIYCSTLYSDDDAINPLSTMVDGIMLFCRIEDMDEGQLQRHIADFGQEAPPIDLVCFCDEKQAPAAAHPPGERIEYIEEKPAPVEPIGKIAGLLTNFNFVDAFLHFER